jgi:hypothetical protein
MAHVEILFAAAALVMFALGYVCGRARKGPVFPRLASGHWVQQQHLAPDEGSVSRQAFDPIVTIPSEVKQYEAFPDAWKSTAAQLARRLESQGVKHVVFVHGTFVGEDPLGIFRLLKDSLGDVGSAVESLLKRALHSQRTRLLDDNAQFVGDYVSLVERALGGVVTAHAYGWSSENHHAGRVSGAVGLAFHLADLPAVRKGSGKNPPARVLVVGHSHAGQLFCLLTQLLARSEGTALLLEVAKERGDLVEGLDEALERLRGIELDFVTLGTPARYGWGRVPGYRVMHIVSHRGEGLRASGGLWSWGGDLVQPLGRAGSDLVATRESDRKANARLETILGPGHAPMTFIQSVKQGVRLSDHGHTVLVDFGEEPGSLWATGLGHGVYTQRKAFLFIFRLIADHFYPPSQKHSVWPFRKRARTGETSDASKASALVKTAP